MCITVWRALLSSPSLHCNASQTHQTNCKKLSLDFLANTYFSGPPASGRDMALKTYGISIGNVMIHPNRIFLCFCEFFCQRLLTDSCLMIDKVASCTATIMTPSCKSLRMCYSCYCAPLLCQLCQWELSVIVNKQRSY